MEKELTTQDWNMVSEVELIYKSKVKATLRPRLKSVLEVQEFLRVHWDENKIELLEQFKLVLLNTGNRVLGLLDLSSGGICGTVADPRLIFTAALKLHATKLILSHNHPSGNLTPSEADKQITQKLKDAGRLLDIEVIDHIIITAEGYFSFADEGLL
ncbi:MAG: JAB domain-containing protein [Sediminibacterium sp.]